DEIGLDDLIAEYLPDAVVANVENADEATVRQMLQMTSGIFNYTESDIFDDATNANPNRAWTAAETIETIYGEESYFASGTDYYYSNSNYNLAQMIIEDVTGISLADNLETRIFQPLGMDSCFLETPERFAQGIVRGYTQDDNDNWDDVTDYNDGVGMADGGVICNAEDLAKFLPGLRDTLLSEAMLEEMLDTVDDGAGGAYGLGMGYDEGEFGMQVGHDGSTSGFQSNMVYLPDEDIVVVILTNNFDSDLVEELTIEAQAIALGEY
ncbi:MAG: serine hydrolase domain-containing protein, partial [Anaerolineae bacterium]|nr:serine hydrolase domain-containing protein [Anaerolineae bacterium]